MGHRHLSLAAAAALAALSLAACSAAEDPPPPAPAGTPAAAPTRICSVSLAGDELLALLVEPERLVCVSNLADDEELSNVAGHYPDTVPRLVGRIEPVLARRPDLVVAAPWNERSFVELLGKSGIAAHVLPDADSFDEIRGALLHLGERVGAPERAAAAVAEMDSRLAALARRVEGAEGRPRVLAFSHLIVAGAGTTFDAIVARAGARNAATEIGVTGHQQLQLERIIAIDPDWIVLGFDAAEDPARVLEAYPLLKTTRAAREGRVVVLGPKYLTTVSPFLVEGAERLARALHPSLFAGAR